MKRVQPKEEIIYPDMGGYTGFSLFLWNISEITERTGVIMLDNSWGGFYHAAIDGDFILEGRVFIFGSLRERELACYRNEKDAKERMAELNRTWTPKMNKIKITQENMWREPNRGGIHIDEILPIWEEKL